MAARADTLKIVLVGDGSVGKTCLLHVYMNESFPEEYVPTVVENFNHDVVVDGRMIRLQLWDTAGQEDYDRLRPLSYPSTDVFLVCFSVDGRSSFRNVEDKWLPELHHYTPRVPVVMVATKIDLRSDPNTIEDLRRQKSTLVSTEEGQSMASRLGARKYVECSAKKHCGLAEVMEEAVRTRFPANGGRKSGKKGHGKLGRPGCSAL